jgi:hypothetical protein
MKPERQTLATADPAALRHLQALARLLDSSISIPGTRHKIGLDPLIGLIPGVGDFAGVLLSASILVSGARLGVPAALLLRMATNIGLEALVGTIPLLGDLFDAGWKANNRNVRIIERYLDEPARSARSNRSWLVGVSLALAAVLLGLVGGAVWLIAALLRLLGFG